MVAVHPARFFAKFHHLSLTAARMHPLSTADPASLAIVICADYSGVICSNNFFLKIPLRVRLTGAIASCFPTISAAMVDFMPALARMQPSPTEH